MDDKSSDTIQRYVDRLQDTWLDIGGGAVAFQSIERERDGRILDELLQTIRKGDNMSLVLDTKEELAKEIYYSGFYAKDWQEQFKTWHEFMCSPEFEEECDRLRSKFD